MAGGRFDVFVSYARASSTQLAIDLQTGLERFAKPWNKLRVMRVFRDDASMAANTALWSTIQEGLQGSEWFILLASPEAAISEYVNDEVAWWLKHKGAHRLLLVHAGGTVAWDNALGDFRLEATAVPRALRDAYREQPRWVDLSWHTQQGSLGKADPRFAERVADLSAAIRGVERDTLIGENVRQHRKTRRLTRAAIAGLSVLLLVALAAGGVAFVQRSEAVRRPTPPPSNPSYRGRATRRDGDRQRRDRPPVRAASCCYGVSHSARASNDSSPACGYHRNTAVGRVLRFR